MTEMTNHADATMNDGKGRLLVVDDMELNRDILSRRFGREGYAVETASTGEEALELIRSGNFDLVLLDIMMPGMDGMEVLKAIREMRSMMELPVIMVSAKDESEDIAAALKISANDYVVKPVKFQEALARTRTQLEIKRLHSELQAAKEAADRANAALDIANRLVRQTFGRYLSDDLVDDILGSPEGAALGGASRVVTVMMTDLRGFTSLSEGLPAESVVNVINIYLERMTEVIMKYQGTIIEFIGDSIFVIFGTPVTRNDDAERAVACAVEMQRAMADVNRRCVEMGFPEVEQGIGLNTGEVVVGNIGSDKRTKYGAVGRNVNLTARIESYALGGQILVSESTLSVCGPVLRIDDRMEVKPKGVKGPIAIYEVGGIGGNFNSYLPVKARVELIELPRPILVRFSILEGKHATEEMLEGGVVRLGPKGAVIQSEAAAERWTDLKLSLFDVDGNEAATDLYAKITEYSPDGKPGFRVDFTSVTSKARVYIEEAIKQASN